MTSMQGRSTWHMSSRRYIQLYQFSQNEEVRKQLDDFSRTASLEEQKRQEQTARTEFAELASNLHHLASTKAIPGVYNPPFSNQKPQAFNVDIETHLNTTFKANYQWKAPSKEKIEFFRALSKEQTEKLKADRVLSK